MRFAFVPQLSENVEHLTLEGMVRSYDADLLREVSEVGSVSWASSTTLDMNG